MKTWLSISVFVSVTVCIICTVVAQEQSEWTEKQWQQFEAAERGRIVAAMTESKTVFATKLGVTDEQAEKLKPILKEWHLQEDELRERHRPVRKEIALLRYHEETERADKKMELLDAESSQLDERFLGKIFSDVLLPFQVKQVKQLAKRNRIVEQANCGDDFDVPLVLADELGLSVVEKQQVAKAVAEVRKEYVKKVGEARKRAEKEILDSLSPERRKRFDDLFGKFYDYPGELQSAREKRREKSDD